MPALPPHNAHQPILHQHAPNEVSRMQNGWRDSGHDNVCHLWNEECARDPKNDQRLKKTYKGGLLQTATMDFPISMETDFDLWAAQLQLSTTIKGVLDEIFYLRRRRQSCHNVWIVWHHSGQPTVVWHQMVLLERVGNPKLEKTIKRFSNEDSEAKRRLQSDCINCNRPKIPRCREMASWPQALARSSSRWF